MSKIVSFFEAANMIKDGDTITCCASAGMMIPEKMLASIEGCFLETGNPKNLTIFFPIAIGDRINLPGLDHLAHKGLIRRLIGGSYVLGRSDGTGNKIAQMILNNEVEAYNLPLGTMMHMLRDTAAKKPGTFTEVGLKTFVDPRQQGGKLNKITKENIVEVVDIDGKEFLRYKPIPINVAIIRATTADENGNLTFEHEPGTLGVLAQAMAAKNNGGKVIAQVKRVTQKSTMNPHSVKVPGGLVDAIVLDPNQMQGTETLYNPWLSGEVKLPLNYFENIAFGADKVVARRAVKEFKRGMTAILGFGIPGSIPKIAIEEEFVDGINFIIEQGSWGGLPVGGLQFGASANPQCIIDSPAQMDFIEGGGFDLACLSFGEVNGHGSVNVSKLGLLIPGCGGFINIVNNAPKIVFCGYFTAGGLQTEIKDGKIKIIKEGKYSKFTDNIEHITYSGEMMHLKQKDVIYITERAVFKLVDQGLEIIEIAPGIDLKKDIIEKISFPIKVASNLSAMDSKLFKLGKIGFNF
ncbi:MAG: hypothetical protein VR72_17300 [Clostridiaceae bacterium BRH_c20a]|nr:MAG: hypothetical protein VR72_17300 [Clostridiaceae bacterium BRH_c20a]